MFLIKCGLTGDSVDIKNVQFAKGFERWLDLSNRTIPRHENSKILESSFEKLVNEYRKVWIDSNQGFTAKLNAWLKSNESLEELDLSGNPLKYAIASVTEALRDNRTLKRLTLDNTYPEVDMFSKTFEEDMNNNQTLTYFSFRDNKLPNYRERLKPLVKRSANLPQITVDLEGTTDS